MRLRFALALVVAALPALAQPADPSAPDPAASAAAASTAANAPDWRVRRSVFFHRLVSPQAILETVPGAAFDFVRGFPPAWGRTTEGAGKRLASQYGQFAIGETIELGVSAFHREDPRYYRMPDASFGRRIKHVIASTFVVRNVKGQPTPAIGRLANVYGAWAIATTWNPPEQRTLGSIFGYGTLGLGIKTGSNAFREFWPDVKKRLKK